LLNNQDGNTFALDLEEITNKINVSYPREKTRAV
jgi:hypothetical protein